MHPASSPGYGPKGHRTLATHKDVLHVEGWRGFGLDWDMCVCLIHLYVATFQAMLLQCKVAAGQLGRGHTKQQHSHHRMTLHHAQGMMRSRGCLRGEMGWPQPRLTMRAAASCHGTRATPQPGRGTRQGC